MKILSVTNSFVGTNNKIKMNNFYSANVNKSCSFASDTIHLTGRLADINDNEFPDELYLNMDDVYKKFETQRYYHRWEKFPFVLSDLLAKRCNFLGLTDVAKGSSVGSSPDVAYGYPRTEYIGVSEIFKKKKNALDIEFEWTREYHELDDFFEENQYEMETIKKGLPEILRKQGWIK